MPKLYNKHHGNAPYTAVYVGRGSPWGNPFVLGTDGDRKEVIAKFEEMVLADPQFIRAIKHELHGKDLVCFCTPAPCHGDVLLRIANNKD